MLNRDEPLQKQKIVGMPTIQVKVEPSKVSTNEYSSAGTKLQVKLEVREKVQVKL